MTEICRERITGPSVWTPQSIGGKESLVRTLSPSLLSEIDAFLDKTKGKPTQEVTREDLDATGITSFLETLRHDLRQGQGAAIVRGVTHERYSLDEFERICWAFGTHLGVPAVQSMRGDRIGYVQVDAINPTGRGSRSSMELYPHTDAYELMGLMSVRKAYEGGVSQLVNSLAVHNAILERRPELLGPLYRGFPQAVFEARFSAQPVTPYAIPVFSFVDGHMSCLYSRFFINAACEKLRVTLPADLAEALYFFENLNLSQEFCLQFMLEPGEIMLWNNYTILHARTAFTDRPHHRRLLLRLWLDVPNGRPVVREIRAHGELYDRLFREAVQAEATA